MCNEIEQIFARSGVVGSETTTSSDILCAEFSTPAKNRFLLGWVLDIRNTHRLSVEVFLSWGEIHNRLFVVRCDQPLSRGQGAPAWTARYCFVTGDEVLRKLADDWYLVPNKESRTFNVNQAFAIIRMLADFYADLPMVGTATAMGG
ncbi:hypothetical protein HZB93_01155 [Candidatus Falkowbacteria bacterium]|nr:hypothetical protein [Candidatus Falkowbacteria bacterium]